MKFIYRNNKKKITIKYYYNVTEKLHYMINLQKNYRRVIIMRRYLKESAEEVKSTGKQIYTEFANFQEIFDAQTIKDAKAVIKEAITVYDNTEKDEIKELLKSILDSISNINAEIDDLIIDLGDLEETVDRYRE